MSVEKLTRTITLGYQLRCYRCGTTGPLGESRDDACMQAEEGGWEAGSKYVQASAEDWCPRCLARREEELDARFTLAEEPR
jgi:hypothetical protein